MYLNRNSFRNSYFYNYINPADILRLKGKGKVEEGYDADLCILDQELQLVEVIAKGNTVYTK